MSRYITDYETVAASQTEQALGPSGKKGDMLMRIVVVPASLSPGAVAIKDGSASAITVFAGGASSLTELKPFIIEVGAKSSTGAWQITTGASVSVVAIGSFT